MDPYFFVDVTASLPMIVLIVVSGFFVYIVVGGFPLFHPEDWGRWKFFDEDVQMGWFNYQLLFNVVDMESSGFVASLKEWSDHNRTGQLASPSRR